MEITTKKIPHNYRNKYLKNTSSALIDINKIANFGKENNNSTDTRGDQTNEIIIELQAQINELKEQINELKTQIGGGDVEDPTGGDSGGGGDVEDPTL